MILTSPAGAADIGVQVEKDGKIHVTALLYNYVLEIDEWLLHVYQIKFMSNRNYILTFCLMFNITVYCQDIKLIKIDSLYSECGVVFPASHNLSIELVNLKKRFTPTIEEIALAEQIFLTEFKNLDHAKSNFPDGSGIVDARDYFDKYIRQYIGFEDQAGNKNILIHLFDNTSKKKVKKAVGTNWKEKFIVILAQPFPFNIWTYRVNLTIKTLNAGF